MRFTNAVIYKNDFQFHRGGFTVENGRFSGGEGSGETIDLGGKTVIPGLIDVHNHGNSGSDFTDGDYAGLVKIARYLLQNGVTSFAPASLSLSEEQLAASYANARRLRDECPEGTSRIRGINMEGPFFNAAKKGAQNPDYLRNPDIGLLTRLAEAAGGMIKIVSVAPELDGAIAFIGEASRKYTVSVAHTTADYAQAKAAFDAGARHVTHLFNAMPPFGHRDPGVVGAAAENPAVRVELITDGIHIHPSVVRAVFAWFGASRVVLVSDAASACGMPDGEYTLGGLKVFVKNRKATLTDGTIAGSTTNLFDCFRRAVSFGVRPEDAIRAASYNPACAIGLENEVGSIEAGKAADYIVCNDDWTISAVYQEGKQIMRYKSPVT